METSARPQAPLTAVVLSFNEELNLSRTLPVLVPWARDVLLVDSFSTDKTIDLARSLGARVVQNRYEYPAQQINWALSNLGQEAQRWILLLNADELPDEELRSEIERVVRDPSSVIDGYYLNFKVMFMGRWIKHGGYYPLWVLRLFRNGRARCEDRKQDEKLGVEGPTSYLPGHVIDENRKDLTYFILKHDAYAGREAQDYLSRRQGTLDSAVSPSMVGGAAARKRRFKQVYDRLPLFLRAKLYYWYRVFFRLGFLDGPEGRAFHFLQAYWYRYLVDLKITEIRKRSASFERV